MCGARFLSAGERYRKPVGGGLRHWSRSSCRSNWSPCLTRCGRDGLKDDADAARSEAKLARLSDLGDMCRVGFTFRASSCHCRVAAAWILPRLTFFCCACADLSWTFFNWPDVSLPRVRERGSGDAFFYRVRVALSCRCVSTREFLIAFVGTFVSALVLGRKLKNKRHDHVRVARGEWLWLGRRSGA